MLITTGIGPPTDPNEERDEVAEGLIPAGFEHNPYSPDELVIRCTNCGVLDRENARENAHRLADSHALDCHNQTGATPISQVAPERPTEGDVATIRYRSRRSSRILTARGPVICFETIETAGQVLYEVHFDQQTSDYERTVVARYQPNSDEEFVARRYMDTAIEVAEEYGARKYTKQRLEVLERALDRVFENDNNKQSGIADFM